VLTNAVAIVGGILAAVFAWRGCSKVRKPAAAAIAMIEFGVLKGIYPMAGRLLGTAELALALALLAPGYWQPFALAAGGLAVFTALIAKSLASGHRIACACFGSDGEPLSGRTLARTGGLLALAVAAVVVGSRGNNGLSTGQQAVGLCVGILAVCAIAIANELHRTHPFEVRTSSHG